MERLKEEEALQDAFYHPTTESVQRIQESFSTYGGGGSPSSAWCRLAYWELGNRVGDQFPVDKRTVNIFADQIKMRCGDDETCLSLETLAKQRCTQPHESVLRTRKKIGLGIAISKEPDGVWLYNRSTAPVFVHSPTLVDIGCKTSTVFKVLPGYCIRAYDPLRASILDNSNNTWPGSVHGTQMGPVDNHSVRISFAKGWGSRDGPSYHRMDVTACPCWLEVMLTTSR